MVFLMYLLSTPILERDVDLDEVITGFLLTKHNARHGDAVGRGG